MWNPTAPQQHSRGRKEGHDIPSDLQAYISSSSPRHTISSTSLPLLHIRAVSCFTTPETISSSTSPSDQQASNHKHGQRISRRFRKSNPHSHLPSLTKPNFSSHSHQAQLDPAPTPSQPADQTPTFTLPHGVSKPYYRFKMTMTCSGCSGAVERVLKRVDKGTGKQYIDKGMWGLSLSLPLPCRGVYWLFTRC